MKHTHVHTHTHAAPYICLFLDKRKYDICLNKGYKILYFTDKKNLIKGYKTDSKYNSIYNEKNVFINEKKLLKKIIDMT